MNFEPKTDTEYLFLCDFTKEDYSKFFDMMSDKKKSRVNSMGSYKSRRQTVAGEMLARKMLAKHHGIAPENIVIKTSQQGKPYAVGCAEFSVSHTDGLAVCCVCDGSPVGIDTEKIRPVDPKILKRVCTQSDLNYVLKKSASFDSLPKAFDKPQLERFFKLWTAKESYFKCCGTGIKNFKSISFANLEKNVKFDSRWGYMTAAVVFA